MILGMSIGSWILIAVIAVWVVIAIKTYFFGGFKKDRKKGLSVGSCCETGDGKTSSCAGCHGCDGMSATRENAVAPTVKLDL